MKKLENKKSKPPFIKRLLSDKRKLAITGFGTLVVLVGGYYAVGFVVVQVL